MSETHQVELHPGQSIKACPPTIFIGTDLQAESTIERVGGDEDLQIGCLDDETEAPRRMTWGVQNRHIHVPHRKQGAVFERLVDVADGKN